MGKPTRTNTKEGTVNKPKPVIDPPHFRFCSECDMHCFLVFPSIAGQTGDLFTKKDAFEAIEIALKRRLISEKDALMLESQIRETNLPFNVHDLAVEKCVTYYNKCFDDKIAKIMTKFPPANCHNQSEAFH